MGLLGSGQGLFGLGKKGGDLSGEGGPDPDEQTGLQQLAGLGGAAAVGYGAYQSIFGDDPTEDLAKSVAARKKAALEGRLGASREELEQQRDAYGQQAAAIADIGGTTAQQLALQQGMSGVPGAGLSGKAVQAQTEYIREAGDIAAKGSKAVGEENLKRVLAESASLADDEKYLASLRAQQGDSATQLALLGGRALLGIASGGTSEAVPLAAGAVK